MKFQSTKYAWKRTCLIRGVMHSLFVRGHESVCVCVCVGGGGGGVSCDTHSCHNSTVLFSYFLFETFPNTLTIS